MPETTEARRQLGRRLLFGAGLAAAVTGTDALRPGAADAAAATTPWKMGGNTGASSANFLGTKDAHALIIKTNNAERMRFTKDGRIGIGVTAPTATVDAASADADGTVVRATAPTNGYGFVSSGGYTGFSSTGGAYGLLSYGTSCGVYADGPTAVRGHASGAGSATYGVYGTGVFGLYGIGAPKSAGDLSCGVYGASTVYGVFGQGSSGLSRGVVGNSTYVGVEANAPTYGMTAHANATTGSNYGLYVSTDSSAGYAVYAQGKVTVNGTLSKSAGSFQIDHPLDPEHRWLRHSFVESPDMMNVYNGNVVLDDDGRAEVDLPDYFGALNGEYRYQLTCIGGHADVYVSREVSDNGFAIAGGTPGLKVSWQVTGIRRDDYAKAHPIVVEEAKTGIEQGARAFVPSGSGAKRIDHGPRLTAADRPAAPER